MKKTSLFLVSLLLASSSAYALAPIIYWVAQTAATVAAETVVVEGVSRGLAAADPYTKTRVRVPTKNIPLAFRKKGGFLNPYWMAFAAVTGLYFEGDEIKQSLSSDEYLYLFCGTVTFGPPDDSVIAKCAYSSAGKERFGHIDSFSPVDMGRPVVAINFGSQFGTVMSRSVTVNYYAETTWSDSFNKFVPDKWHDRSKTTPMIGYVSADPLPAGATVTAPTDDELASLAAAYLAADNRPAAAFMDTAGKPIPELFEGAEYDPLPNVNADTAALLADYRAGVLQTTNTDAAHYVSPEKYEELKKLAGELDYDATPEGELDALNEKIKQPLTQAQYEETNKKYAEGIDAVTAALNASTDSEYSDMDQHFEDLDGIITDLPNTSLPAPAHMTVPQYVDCKQIHLSDGNGHELDFPSESQCAKIETFKQGFGYFLAISVVFLLSMQLLTRPHG